MRHEASTEDGSFFHRSIVVFDQAEVSRGGEGCAFHDAVPFAAFRVSESEGDPTDAGCRPGSRSLVGEPCRQRGGSRLIDYSSDVSEPLDPLPVREFLGQEGLNERRLYEWHREERSLGGKCVADGICKRVDEATPG